MKNLSLYVLLTLFFITSCTKKDKCEDIVCQNNGTCVDGTCQCPAGYEGDRCQNESLPKSIKISSIKITKWPSNKADGTKWDNDGTNPDIYPSVFTMKADGKSVDQTIWTSSLVILNTNNAQPELSIINPELKFTTIDKQYAIFLFEKDDSSVESMGSGIIFNLKDFIKGRPATIKLDCGSGAACVLGFEIKVSYEL